MPIRYVCRNCNYVLYDSKNKPIWGKSWGLPTPSEIIRWYGGYCPRCGKKLKKPDIMDITVREL